MEQIKNIEQLKNDFLFHWLSFTTCRTHSDRKIIYTSECGQYIIAKHSGHTEHLYRTEYGYCETFYELHNINIPKEKIRYPSSMNEGSAIHTWKGRWSKAKQNEAEEIIKSLKEK